MPGKKKENKQNFKYHFKPKNLKIFDWEGEGVSLFFPYYYEYSYFHYYYNKNFNMKGQRNGHAETYLQKWHASVFDIL